MRRSMLALAVVVGCVAWPGGLRAADWPEFRGPGGRGVAAGEAIRTAWSEREGIAWKAELPGRSAASPIVVGDLVVTTASSVAPSHASWRRVGIMRTIAESTFGGGSNALGGTMNISDMS